ncbi:MAG: methyl-accepting chemotaxis protein [Chitinispirillales bacterium]|jgi:methyl-accepting chemotaxis protein|nr:methyl-accepting chemotaxis protein [Chitinispirillales bacterium]
MNIRLKILSSIVVATVATALIIGTVSISNARTITFNAEKKEVMEARSTLRNYLKDSENELERAARMATVDQDLIGGLDEFLRNGNRLKLNNAVLRIAQHGVLDFLTVTDMNGIVAMHSHQPSKFGDSDAGLPHIKAAISGKRTVAYETGADNPITLRCGVPITQNGKQIGVVGAGYNFGTNAFVDKMKAFTGAEITMFCGENRVATTVLNVRGERNTGTKLDGKIAKQVLSGREYTGESKVLGKKMFTCYAPIRNAADSVFGMILVGTDITQAQNSMRNAVITVIIIMLVLCAAAVLIGLYIAGDIAKPLSATVNMMNELGRGHLDVRLNLSRKDEIGVMAKAVDMFADDMQNVVIGTMKKISVGDLSAKIELKDDKDEISGALKKTVESLSVVVGTMKKISVGDLSVVIEPKDERDEISNALKRTVESLHGLIIDDGGRVFNAAAGKDLSQRLTCPYQGEFARMKDNINTVMQNLDDALSHVTATVSQVSSASNELSHGAQNFAECSSEQASSLEEVSSTLEAMSSMTKQNAGNSNQAMVLASEARVAANNGDISMKRMAEAINHIKQSADNTAKIIKTIDDIAFQTNLLALNAAVEAARAGEAGKGFAVVAEEVRNLAMLSAEAAKNTADMIEESVKNADGGVKITVEVAKSLGQILDRTGKVGDLIAEIAAVCNAQADGIEQVNISVANMSQVTQRNAANSEESAGASEELSNLAADLAGMVREFQLSEGGAARYTAGQQSGSKRNASQPQIRRLTAITDKRADTPKSGGTRSIKSVKAGEIIPLDDSELSEF